MDKELNGDSKVLAERLEGLRADVTELKDLMREAIRAGESHRQDFDRRLTVVETDLRNFSAINIQSEITSIKTELKHFNAGDIKSEISAIKSELSTRPTYKQVLIGIGMIMVPVVVELVVGAMILIN